jgi:cell division protein FtsQ
MASVPTLKPQLASATWVGSRRWDLNFQSGETVVLPEGEAQASEALAHFAKHDRAEGLLGRGIVQFDLRNWPRTHQMTVRLPRAPGEPIRPPSAPPAPQEG